MGAGFTAPDEAQPAPLAPRRAQGGLEPVHPFRTRGKQMKTLPVALAFLFILPAGGVLAHGPDTPADGVHVSCCDSPARWAPRHDPRDARLAIDSEGGNATLLITDGVVALQLSDRTLRKANRELRNEEDEEDNAIARAVMAAVLSGVRTLLDHSAECPVRDLRDVQYRGGRLVLTTEGGDRLFDGLDVNDRTVLECFSDRDARLFVREFQRVKDRLR